MIVFCAFEQIQTVVEYGKRYGFMHYYPIFFIKNYSPQVLKANMKIVGATEYAVVLYRDKLPKFNNNGKMIFDWFNWERDNKKIYPKIHPTQKPIHDLKREIINIERKIAELEDEATDTSAKITGMPHSGKLGDKIGSIVSQIDYYESVQKKKEVSKECLSEIKKNAPKSSGDYKKGWRLKTEYDRKNDTRVIIYNKTTYQLTHLLEHGHAKAGGGRVEGKPHIAPAEKNAVEKLVKRVEEIVKK